MLSAIEALGSDDILAFTSGNAVRALEGTSPELIQRLKRARVAVVGEGTAAAVRRLGMEKIMLSPAPTARALGVFLSQQLSGSGRVLFLKGDTAGPDLLDALPRDRASEFVVYRSRAHSGLEERIRDEEPKLRALSALIFMNALAAESFAVTAQRIEGLFEKIRQAPVIVTGAKSAAHARAAGFQNVVEAADPSVSAVATAALQTVG